jgi:hypothetical protein
VNTLLSAVKPKPRASSKTHASGSLVRRDQDTSRPRTQGKSSGSGREASSNVMKEYTTGRQPGRGKLIPDDFNQRTTASARHGFEHVGQGLTRTP